MEVIRGRMVHLGYGKFWRSDEIVGLSPIEKDRGPGRRTEVFVAGRSTPIVASRTEEAILEEMVHLPDEEFDAEDARRLLTDLLRELGDLPRVLRRLLRNEAELDVEAWERRIKTLLDRESETVAAEEQGNLFPDAP